MDTAENLSQIGQWTRDSYTKEQRRIELYLSLTRKNLNALESFPLSVSFLSGFKKFCVSFEKLEEEYRTGMIDRNVWAQGMLTWGNTLAEIVHLI